MSSGLHDYTQTRTLWAFFKALWSSFLEEKNAKKYQSCILSGFVSTIPQPAELILLMGHAGAPLSPSASSEDHPTLAQRPPPKSFQRGLQLKVTMALSCFSSWQEVWFSCFPMVSLPTLIFTLGSLIYTQLHPHLWP